MKAFLRCLILVLASACTSSTAPVAGPDQTLRAYTAAIRAGDADAAYALLDEDTQAEITGARFRELVATNQAELGEQADAIDRRLEEGVEARAVAELPSGERAVAVLEAGRWWMAGGVLNAPVLRTPRDAVLALRRALARRSLSGTFRVLARESRAELEAEIQRFLDDTEDELGLDYEIRGNVASVRTTSGRTVRLVREAGEWHVVDIE